MAIDRLAGAMRDDRQRLSATISGRVQGVGYRWWIRSRAEELGLCGWVMNDAGERSVSLVAEGPAAAIDRFEQLIVAGPPGARVDRVAVAREPPSGAFDRFEITRP